MKPQPSPILSSGRPNRRYFRALCGTRRSRRVGTKSAKFTKARTRVLERIQQYYQAVAKGLK